MRRRLVRMALVMVVVPVAVHLAESTADRMEAVHGPSTGSRALRRSSAIGRRWTRR